jgi:hypothetical protein
LATVLERRVRLDLRAGTFMLLERESSSTRALVLVALLAQQALHLLDERHPAGLAPREIELRTGVQGGTLRPILKRLADQSDVRKDDETGAYSVPSYALSGIAKAIDRRDDK